MKLKKRERNAAHSRIAGNLALSMGCDMPYALEILRNVSNAMVHELTHGRPACLDGFGTITATLGKERDNNLVEFGPISNKGRKRFRQAYFRVTTTEDARARIVESITRLEEWN